MVSFIFLMIAVLLGIVTIYCYVTNKPKAASIITTILTLISIVITIFPEIFEQEKIEASIILECHYYELADEYILKATVSPDNAIVEWDSNNRDIVTVDDNGYLKAISEGTATITASIKCNGEIYSDTCTILVNMSPEKNIPDNIDNAEHISDNSRNTFADDTSLPVSDRVLVPEDSLYQDINMEAVYILIDSAGSAPGYQGTSRTSDAVASPFTKNILDPRRLFIELEYEILKNPIVGDMIARGIINEYSDIIIEEPWIKDFLDASNKAYESFMDSYSHEANYTGYGYWMTAYKFEDGKVGRYVTNEYRKYAESLCKLLETFINHGVHTFTSKQYYACNNAISENRRTEVIDGELAYQALILYKINEDGEIVCVIGFDLNDKGLFIYDLNVIQP